MPAEQSSVEEINVIHVGDISIVERAKVEAKAKEREMKNFIGYAEVHMVSTSPMRVEDIEPIEGTPAEWFKKKNGESEIDTTDIF